MDTKTRATLGHRIADTHGIDIEVGDTLMITAYGWNARLIDTGRKVTVTGFTRGGNVTHDGGDYGLDRVANGKPLRPGCVSVMRRDGESGFEGNR